jgi:hypothetical protein
MPGRRTQGCESGLAFTKVLPLILSDIALSAVHSTACSSVHSVTGLQKYVRFRLYTGYATTEKVVKNTMSFYLSAQDLAQIEDPAQRPEGSEAARQATFERIRARREARSNTRGSSNLARQAASVDPRMGVRQPHLNRSSSVFSSGHAIEVMIVNALHDAQDISLSSVQVARTPNFFERVWNTLSYSHTRSTKHEYDVLIIAAFAAAIEHRFTGGTNSSRVHSNDNSRLKKYMDWVEAETKYGNAKGDKYKSF